VRIGLIIYAVAAFSLIGGAYFFELETAPRLADSPGRQPDNAEKHLDLTSLQSICRIGVVPGREPQGCRNKIETKLARLDCFVSSKSRTIVIRLFRSA